MGHKVLQQDWPPIARWLAGA